MWSTIRSGAACFQVIARHLGNGQTTASEVACPNDQIVQALGVAPVDVAAELVCADPVRCGMSKVDWDPNACTPYDPLSLPAPPPVPKDSTYDPPCPLADGPWLMPAAEEPTSTGAPDPGNTSAPGAGAGLGLGEPTCRPGGRGARVGAWWPGRPADGPPGRSAGRGAAVLRVGSAT